MEAILKTPEEIQKLKDGWRHDPIWDIERTEGFEAHFEELKAYRLEVEKEKQERREKELLEKAEKLGIPGNIMLAKYIQKLEDNIDHHIYRLDKLERRVNGY